MSSAVGELQQVQYERLSTLQVLTDWPTNHGGGCRVYDDVPENSTYPYITLGEATENNTPNTNRSIGRKVVSTFHIWSRYHGMAECKALSLVVIEAFDKQRFSLPTWLWEKGTYVFGEWLNDPDGITRHGVVKIETILRKDLDPGYAAP